MRVVLVALAACSSSPSPSPNPNPPIAISIDARPIDAAPPPSPDATLDVRLNAGGNPDRVHDDEPTPNAILKIAMIDTTTPDTKLAKTLVADKIASAYFPQLRRCYRKALAGDHTMRGKLKLPLDIAPDGKTRAHDATFVVDASVATCAESVAATWRFPSPGKATATYVVHVVMLPE